MTCGPSTPIAKKSMANSRARSSPIKATYGSLLSNGHDKLARWDEHVCEVLNTPAPAFPGQVEDPQDTLPVNTERFMEEEEVRNAIKPLKNNKVPGMDGINTEMVRLEERWPKSAHIDFVTKTGNSRNEPEGWKNGCIVCIPKKGKLKECDNWKAVTQLSILGKVYC